MIIRADKERIVDIDKNTSKAIWKNLLPRLDEIQEDYPTYWMRRTVWFVEHPLAFLQ